MTRRDKENIIRKSYRRETLSYGKEDKKNVDL